MIKIYVTHSTDFDFKKELYAPIRKSSLNSKYNILLPHETPGILFNSKEYMKVCDLIVAEVSYPSTGQGIELGWANLYEKPILCIYKTGVTPSGSLKAVSKDFIEYSSLDNLLQKLEIFIEKLKK
jgi:hypothetical protein